MGNNETKETKGKMAAYADWDALKSEIAWYNKCRHNVDDMIVVGDDVWCVLKNENGVAAGVAAFALVNPVDDRRLSSTVSETVLLGWFK